MKVVSSIAKIANDGYLTTEYIESELTKLNINPLRWAIVDVDDKIISISIADLQK